MTYILNALSFILKFFQLLYGWILGSFYYLLHILLHNTCSIRFEGTDISAYPNCILCIWHESFPLHMVATSRLENQVWMAHPVWYMKHIVVLLKLMGMKHICLGSSGHGGMKALAKVISYLKRGYSTTIACDGPAGPVHELKKGVLLMSSNTGVPVIPIRFKPGCNIRTPEWDKKKVPIPFSKITVQVGEAVYVTKENFEASAKKIAGWLAFQ